MNNHPKNVSENFVKKISDLSIDEYMKIFPTILKDYNVNYKEWYENEKLNIINTIETKYIARINHIGSSSIIGLLAKPIIDILLEIDGCCNYKMIVDDLKKIGYGEEIISKTYDPLRFLVGKGYSVNGYAEKVFHLHIRYIGNWDELYFRDYLIAHPEISIDYGKLKKSILNDIEKGLIDPMPNGILIGYTNVKLDFIQKYSAIAKQEFKNKYKPK